MPREFSNALNWSESLKRAINEAELSARAEEFLSKHNLSVSADGPSGPGFIADSWTKILNVASIAQLRNGPPLGEEDYNLFAALSLDRRLRLSARHDDLDKALLELLARAPLVKRAFETGTLLIILRVLARRPARFESQEELDAVTDDLLLGEFLGNLDAQWEPGPEGREIDDLSYRITRASGLYDE